MMDLQNIENYEQLVTYLKENKYCVMTDDEGVALYNEEGMLQVCQENSERMLLVEDSEVIRELYNLPIKKEEKLSSEEKPIKQKEDAEVITEEDGGTGEISLGETEEGSITDSDTNRDGVWQGRESTKWNEATKALLELYGSDFYQKKMIDRNTVKLNIWTQIALDMENRGFKVCDTAREAGLKCSQKWRNLERCYWHFLANPDLQIYTNRKWKNFSLFFDSIHNIISKRKFYKMNCQRKNYISLNQREAKRKKLVDRVSGTPVYEKSNNLTQSTPTLTTSLAAEASTTAPMLSTTSTPSVQPSEYILLEMKKNQEAALAANQQNFSKIISLLEEQTEHLKTLSSLFTQYATSRSNKSSSKNNHKTNRAPGQSQELEKQV